jgi:hypothetical protein
VAIIDNGPTRSRQISAVARRSALSVRSATGIDALARLSTGIRSSTTLAFLDVRPLRHALQLQAAVNALRALAENSA